MTASRLVPLSIIVLLAACQRPTPPAVATDTVAASRTVDSITPDTHVLDLADSTEVWLTVGRVGRGPTGAPCLERGIQLRKGPLKIPVPLLYTSKLPAVVGGKLVATLSNNCVSGDEYSIDPRTAQPTKLEHSSR